MRLEQRTEERLENQKREVREKQDKEMRDRLTPSLQLVLYDGN